MINRSLKLTAFLTIVSAGLLSSSPLAGMDLLGYEDAGPAFKPDVTAVTPMAGRVGTTVTIKGLDLDRVTSVRFGPNIEAKATWVNDNKIQVTVPEGAILGPIALESHVGTIDTNFTFSVATPK